MIRQLIARVFGGRFGRKNSARAGAHGKPASLPATIPASRHGIRREAVSHGSRQTVETLQQHGYQAYIVGGAVRDLLAGIPPKDYDVATNATPEQVRRCFRRARIVGRRFQIVHVMMGRETIEVTTFRGNHETHACGGKRRKRTCDLCQYQKKPSGGADFLRPGQWRNSRYCRMHPSAVKDF